MFLIFMQCLFIQSFCLSLSSCHCFVWRNNVLVFTQFFWKSNPLSLNVLARKLSLTWNSHSTSFYVIHFAITSREGIAYRHIIMLALNLKVSEEVAVEIAENCRFWQTPLSFYAPPRGTPMYISISKFLETSHWPTFFPLTECVYLHSYICGGFQKTHLWCNLRISHSG